MQSKSDLAEQDFQLASKLAPEKNLSYVAMGVSYIQMGDLPKAIASLRRRIREKPNDAPLHYLLGEALIRAGTAPGNATFSEAKLALTKSVKLNPKFPNSRVDLAKLYIRENRLDEAIEQLEQVRTLDPKDKAAYSQLAIVYRKKGRPELASSMLATLNKLNDEDRKGERRLRLTMAGGEAAPGERKASPNQ
jgi:Flp pilus assembly protein TadD